MADYDPTDLLQQEVDDDLRRATERLAVENDDSDIEWLMSGPKGRRIVRRLLEQAGVFASSFHPNAMQMSCMEGKKQVGYWLLSQIEQVSPNGYHEMMREARNARKQ